MKILNASILLLLQRISAAADTGTEPIVPPKILLKNDISGNDRELGTISEEEKTILDQLFKFTSEGSVGHDLAVYSHVASEVGVFKGSLDEYFEKHEKIEILPVNEGPQDQEKASFTAEDDAIYWKTIGLIPENVKAINTVPENAHDFQKSLENLKLLHSEMLKGTDNQAQVNSIFELIYIRVRNSYSNLVLSFEKEDSKLTEDQKKRIADNRTSAEKNIVMLFNQVFNLIKGVENYYKEVIETKKADNFKIIEFVTDQIELVYQDNILDKLEMALFDFMVAYLENCRIGNKEASEQWAMLGIQNLLLLNWMANSMSQIHKIKDKGEISAQYFYNPLTGAVGAMKKLSSMDSEKKYINNARLSKEIVLTPLTRVATSTFLTSYPAQHCINALHANFKIKDDKSFTVSRKHIVSLEELRNGLEKNAPIDMETLKGDKENFKTKVTSLKQNIFNPRIIEKARISVDEEAKIIKTQDSIMQYIIDKIGRGNFAAYDNYKVCVELVLEKNTSKTLIDQVLNRFFLALDASLASRSYRDMKMQTYRQAMTDFVNSIKKINDSIALNQAVTGQKKPNKRLWFLSFIFSDKCDNSKSAADAYFKEYLKTRAQVYLSLLINYVSCYKINSEFAVENYGFMIKCLDFLDGHFNILLSSHYLANNSKIPTLKFGSLFETIANSSILPKSFGGNLQHALKNYIEREMSDSSLLKIDEKAMDVFFTNRILPTCNALLYIFTYQPKVIQKPEVTLRGPVGPNLKAPVNPPIITPDVTKVKESIFLKSPNLLEKICNKLENSGLTKRLNQLSRISSTKLIFVEEKGIPLSLVFTCAITTVDLILLICHRKITRANGSTDDDEDGEFDE